MKAVKEVAQLVEQPEFKIKPKFILTSSTLPDGAEVDDKVSASVWVPHDVFHITEHIYLVKYPSPSPLPLQPLCYARLSKSVDDIQN